VTAASETRPPAPRALIEIRDVSKTFAKPDGERFTALRDIGLTIGDREFVSFLGPSGCGKTTLLKMIDKIIAPEQGEILLDDAPIDDSLDSIAFVFQEIGLMPWRTVLGNISLGLQARHMPKAERLQVAREYADLVGLSAFLDYYPHQLSGGMQQRVGLARALAVKPKVLLMDEPFGALDAMTRSTLQTELARIWETLRMTVVFVTHDISEAIFLSDRIVVFDKSPGRVQEDVVVDIPRPRTERGVAGDLRAAELHAHLLDVLSDH
jgi:NitT/TauT family transport system ATP-binding protein